ncbi:trypsin-like serine protease [Streptomyces sp. NPDC099050]|uniref:trypsin-like serine protease n=1 Tax=Streptomyces sp. NPDC099050 TaxID=3366100 RepID=UPI003805E2A2
MSAPRPRSTRATGLLLLTAAVSTSLLSAGQALAVAGPEADVGQYAYAAKLNIGDEANSRACTAVLVDANWILTAASCFADTPGQTPPAGKPKLKATVTLGSGSAEIAELVPRSDRDVVLAKLTTPVTGVTPAKFASTAPSAGSALTAAGFGRTKTEWVPDKVHTGSFTAGATTATEVPLSSASGTTDTICQGDAGGPVLNTDGEVTAISSRSWKGGCLGTNPTETRTSAISVRTDDLREWIDTTRAQAPGWKTQALVQSGSSIYQATRVNDGSWTGFTDVQSKATSIGGIRTAAAAGIDSATHVLAVSNNGGLFHTVRNPNGTWAAFGDVFPMTNSLGGLTQVSAVSIGGDLHVVAVASGKVFHTMRKADGNWTRFGDLSAVAGQIGTVTSVATAATASGQLQVVPVAGGKAFHTIRNAAGQWSAWGNIAAAAGDRGPISSVSMAGIGGDAHIVIATDNGTRQHHGMRNANGTWEAFAELNGVLGTITTKSVAAAGVNGELQLTVTTTDGKVLHTTRRTDRTWATTLAVPGLPANPGQITITATLNN